MESKRDFLKKLGLITAATLTGGAYTAAGAKLPVAANQAKKKVGLQIYSLGRELGADVPNGLKRIKEIGYSTIELAGYRDSKVGNIDVAEYRKLAEDTGLKITGSHVNAPARQFTRDNMGEIVEFWKKATDDHVKLGVNTLVQPMMPAIANHSDVEIVCEVFNKAGEIAKNAGIRWGYHNHQMEFQRVVKEEDRARQTNPWMPVGDIIYDLMLKGTDPGLVFFEMDVYWTVMGQNDPLEYFDKYAGRFPILHIKDRSILGRSGMMNFENIFNKAYQNGLEEFYVELENIREGVTQFEGVKLCFDYLNQAPFVK